MKSLITLLYCLSLTIINPWGLSRGAIWTQPKVLVILIIIGLNLSLLWEKKQTLQLCGNWKILAFLWGTFLTITLLFSTLATPYPPYSFWGQNQMGDGWVYWLIVAVFTLSNILVLKHYPELLRPQIKGLLCGGIIVALSVFPQIIDWRIDYTATMGQLIRDNLLESTIFKNQQPIGLYSHRGHAGFVLAAISALFLVVWQWGWLKSSQLIIALSITLSALLLTQNRASLIALLFATIFLLGQKYTKLLITATLVCILVLGIATTTRKLGDLPALKQITSDRIKLWQDSLSGISQRPFFGWGFDGYGSAYAYLRQPEKIERMESVGDFSVEYLAKNGQFRTLALPTAKAHNLILDTLLSVGFIGLLLYGLVWFYSISLLIKSSVSKISVLVYTYFVFTLFWFECAQYTHLSWWVLSLWGIRDLKLVSSNQLQPQPLSVWNFFAVPPKASVAITSKLAKTLTAGLLLSAFILGSGIYFFTRGNFLLLNFASAIPKSASTCGSVSSGPTDNPITTRYGQQAYQWTDNIKWNCVYNIKDFKGKTAVSRYNAARDLAVAKGGGVIYFPAGNYQFTDNLYLKDGIVIRGETPTQLDAKQSNYDPTTKFIFPKYQPSFYENGTPNHTAFKKILTVSPNTDSNFGIVNIDINRAGIYWLGNVDVVRSSNIVIYGVRTNNVADPIPFVPDRLFQSPWLRYSDPFSANIKVTAYQNVIVSNNRLNDAITDNYDQPNYQIMDAEGESIINHLEGWKVPFDYTNHYGIVVNRTKAETRELDFAPAATPEVEPGLFREGITIRDNWIYHTMRAGILASGLGLVIQDNEIKDRSRKQWWTNPFGTVVPPLNVTYENRGIDWAGWKVLIKGNRYQVYRHQLGDSENYSIDGEGILIQECCGGTQVNQAVISDNIGNSYIGLYKTPYIKNILITHNQLNSNVTKTALIYVNADTNSESHAMYDVRIENNFVNGSIVARSSLEGSGNTVENNLGNDSGEIKTSCHVQVNNNEGFAQIPCEP